MVNPLWRKPVDNSTHTIVDEKGLVATEGCAMTWSWRAYRLSEMVTVFVGMRIDTSQQAHLSLISVFC